MGWLSKIAKGAKKAVSSAWDSTKDAIKDVTGVSSMNDFMFPGFGISSALGTLQGQGFMGQQLMRTMNPMLQQPGGAMMAPSGPLFQSAPALSMGTAPVAAPAPQASGVAGLFGESGYRAGQGEPTSTALLQAQPEAYQYTPLLS